MTYHASDSLITARHLENIQNKKLDVIPENLANQGVNVVITRWIRKDLAKSLCDNKIQLYVGVSTQEPDKLIEDYIEGDLETNDKMCY